MINTISFFPGINSSRYYIPRCIGSVTTANKKSRSKLDELEETYSCSSKTVDKDRSRVHNLENWMVSCVSKAYRKTSQALELIDD